MRSRLCFSPLLTFLMLVSVLLVSAPAQAQIVLTLTQSFLAGAPSSTVTYQASIANQSATQSVFVNSILFNFVGTDGDTQDVINDVDTASFFGYFQAAFPTRQLPANTTYTGSLVDVSIRANAPAGAIDNGTLTLEGGVTADELNTLDQAGFSIGSTVVLPEYSSLSLLGSGTFALFGVILLRRPKKST